MHEIRIHGRGGQGAVVASKILAVAGVLEDKHVQAFPSFGAERRGAPVAAFVRLDKEPVMLRTEIHEPDGLIVLDPSLIVLGVDITKGLKENSWILINSDENPDHFEELSDYQVGTVDASEIALSFELGTKTAPIVNTSILGAFSKFTELIKMDSIVDAIQENVPAKKENNIKAAKEAFDSLKGEHIQ